MIGIHIIPNYIIPSPHTLGTTERVAHVALICHGGVLPQTHK